MKQEPAIQDLFDGATARAAAAAALLQQSVRVGPRGRGTGSSPTPRFTHKSKEAVADSWYLRADDSQKPVATKVHVEQARTVISRNQSPDVPFNQSINPYRGCEHGCVYCYARPSHSFVDLSPGLDFETQIFAKTNAAALLERELLAPGYRCSPINLGANTDPYQPVEKDKGITREILEVLDRLDHPVTIITKGALILRDLDILERMAKRNLVSVAISITTLDNKLKRTLEPRAASPGARLRTMRELTARGIPVTLLLAPVIPALNDHEIESIVNAAADAGARSARYIFLRLPFEVKELFSDWLIDHYPLRARHVLNLIGESRGGKAYDADFAQRMTGTGPYAKMIRKRFDNVVSKRHLNVSEQVELDTGLFTRNHPSQAQLSLI
ncbi:MAG: PA0069 family radical SAM protein [Gammaproteobacteria bacterium]